jgi:hypothetical protein
VVSESLATFTVHAKDGWGTKANYSARNLTFLLKGLKKQIRSCGTFDRIFMHCLNINFWFLRRMHYKPVKVIWRREG